MQRSAIKSIDEETESGVDKEKSMQTSQEIDGYKKNQRRRSIS